MLGVIDVGGGMRGAYTAGIYDLLMDQKLQPFDYCLGVSAGSANLVSYLALQRGRNLRFYNVYAFRKEYMSAKNFLKHGSYIDLDYIYSTLCNEDGEDPVDYDAFARSTARYEAVVTDAATGKAVYYDKSHIRRNDFSVIKASCAVPGAARPYPVEGRPGFDGGVADPVPYQHALEQGCDKLVVLLTRPADFVRPPLEHHGAMKALLRRWPNTMEALEVRYLRYNGAVAEVKALEAQGKALLLAPDSIAGMETLTKDETAVQRLYQKGYKDGEKILDFM